jgi:Putative DNA-binding domain
MPSPDLRPVKPNLDVLVQTALATGGETDRFDFKELLNLASDEHKVRLVKAIGAFGNTNDGGFVLVGISDDRRVVGLADEIADAYDQTRVHAIVAQYLSPPARFQVRQHQYQSKRIVVIEVSSFEEVPSVVRQSATFGKEKLIAGTFLFRSKAAKSGVLEADQDVRALCETLVKRRASAFLDLVQRGSIGTQIVSTAARFTSEAELRNRADRVWPTLEKGKPSVEVGFAPVRDLQLTPEQMKTLIPAACIPVQHGFPFHQVGDKWVQKPVSWGWYGRIPVAEVDAETPEPSYLWMLSRAGAFICREHLWEDSADPSSAAGWASTICLGMRSSIFDSSAQSRRRSPCKRTRTIGYSLLPITSEEDTFRTRRDIGIPCFNRRLPRTSWRRGSTLNSLPFSIIHVKLWSN